MSLVNDMLRDLDRRKHSPGQQEQRVINALDSIDDSKNYKTVIFFGIAVAGVVIGLLAGLLYYRAAGTAAQPELPVRDNVVPASSIGTQVAAVETVNEEDTRGEVAELTAMNTQRVEGRITVQLLFSGEVDYQILSQTGQVLDILLLDTIIGDDFSQPQGGMLNGLRIFPVENGLSLSLELDSLADFLVHDEVQADNSGIVIEAEFRELTTSVSQTSAVPGEQQNDSAAPIQEASVPSLSAADAVTPPLAVTESNSGTNSAAGIKTARVLSFEEQDRNVSQSGIRFAQRGQIIDAYNTLLTFIEQNPEAHRSRESLITILFAQQEYQQAASIVQQGLVLAPNYAPYKKLRARLLIMDGRSGVALTLLKNVPPLLEADIEYHDLLASLYQQTGDHKNAVLAYQELLKNDQTQARWWAGMAISLEAIGDFPEALASYQRAIQGPDLDASIYQFSQSRIQVLTRQL